MYTFRPHCNITTEQRALLDLGDATVDKVNDANETLPGWPGGSYYLALQGTKESDRRWLADYMISNVGADPYQVEYAFDLLASPTPTRWGLGAAVVACGLAVGGLVGVLFGGKKKCEK